MENRITALTAADVATRLAAAEELSQLGEEAQPAAVALAQACGDACPEVRDFANAALENLGPPRPADVAALIKLLESPREDVVYWAATLLGRLETAAAAAGPTLAKVVGGATNAAAKQRAAWALGKIGPAAAVALPQLRQATAADDPRLARLAQEAMDCIQGDS